MTDLRSGRARGRPPLDRAIGRAVFGGDSDGYDRVRADYPEAFYDRLSQRSGGLVDQTAFEIGPGTGLATRRLLASGLRSLTVFEPDVKMVRHLRKTVADGRLRIVGASFERSALAGSAYDVGIAAASFHWLDQQTALAHVRRILRPGGQWTMWWNVYRTNSPHHPLSKRIEALISHLPQPPSETKLGHHSLDVDARLRDLKVAGFVDTEHRLLRRDRNLTSSEVRALYATFSFVRVLDEGQRDHLLDSIAEVVTRDFGGLVPSPILTAGYFGTTPRSAAR